MSFSAVEWAFRQPVKPSSAKFVLVAMAQAVNASRSKEMVCFPSTAAIADATGQDRKTVLDGIRRLRDLGYIAPTGNLRGRTAQVTEYLLKSPESGTVSSESNSTENGTLEEPEPDDAEASNSTEFGTVEQSRKRNSPENGPGPFFPSNSTVFPAKQYRFSHETVPKTGHGIRKEQGMEQGIEKGKKRATLPSIDMDMFGGVLRDVDPQVLADFRVLRKELKAPITETALAGLAREGGKAGLTLTEVMRTCCENGWRGFKAEWQQNAQRRGGQSGGGQGAGGRRNPHVGTDQRDYEGGFDGKTVA